MVMAAGLGKRMRPLTATRPKPLVEVAGKALDRPCLQSAALGRGEAARSSMFTISPTPRGASEIASKALTIAVSDERTLLMETGGGIVKARDLLGDKPFLVRQQRQSLGRWACRCDPAARRTAGTMRSMDALLLMVPLAQGA
jgi:MurNAc alpha-1-phosphate uridylyltransferase